MELKPKSSLLALAIVLCWHALLSADERRPNVVFILADDLGWSDTTLNGTTNLYQTPNIQRLAKRGMTFTRAYSASPLCSPTRSAILTGLSPARTGITVPGCHLPKVVLEASIAATAAPNQKAVQPESVTRLKTEYDTLPKILKNHGYRTAHFGKWHLGHEPYSPLQHGFDVDVPHHPGPGPAGSYVAPWKFKDFDHDPDVPDQHIEDRMSEEAVRWLEQNHEEPFFLNYWMFSVHAPFDAKQSLIKKYEQIVNDQDKQHCPTYAAMIESMDDAVGTLLDTLDRLGVAENTIIVFTSDNGGNMYSDVDGTVPTSNWPLRGGKATMFEGGTRVPCIVSWPGTIEPGSRSDVMIQSEDYLPTLLDALNIQRSEEHVCDGTSFVPVLKNEPFTERSKFQYFPHAPAVPDWLPPSVSVHRDNWKLIRIFHGGEKGQHRHMLFNLAEDLTETTNMAGEHPQLVKELDTEIEQFLKLTNAIVPVANPAFDPAKYRIEDEGVAKPKPKRKQPAASQQVAMKDSIAEFSPWKFRQCQGEAKDGKLLITATGKDPFLGVGPGPIRDHATITIRIRCNGGAGKVAWLPGGTANPGAEMRTSDFAIKAGDWANISLQIPGQIDESGILRLYLPQQDDAVEIDWVELKGLRLSKRWDF